jgi:hypothetical protein
MQASRQAIQTSAGQVATAEHRRTPELSMLARTYSNLALAHRHPARSGRAGDPRARLQHRLDEPGVFGINILGTKTGRS